MKRAFLLIALSLALTACGRAPGNLATTNLPDELIGTEPVVTEALAPLHGQLTVRIFPIQGTNPVSAENVARFEVTLLNDQGQVVATQDVAGAETTEARFDSLPLGSYAMTVRAFDDKGKAVNANAPEAENVGTVRIADGQITQSQATVPLAANFGVIRRSSRSTPVGRLELGITLQAGAWKQHSQEAVQAHVSTPAQGPFSLAETLSGEAAIDNEDQLPWADEIEGTLAGQFTAFTTDRNGDNPTYMGPVTFQSRQGADAENGENATLVVNMPGTSLKFYMKADGSFIGLSNPYASDAIPESFYLVDPELVPGATFPTEAAPEGTPVRRYFFVTGTMKLWDFYFGPNQGDGLLAATLPMGGDRVVHIRRL